MNLQFSLALSLAREDYGEALSAMHGGGEAEREALRQGTARLQGLFLAADPSAPLVFEVRDNRLEPVRGAEEASEAAGAIAAEMDWRAFCAEEEARMAADRCEPALSWWRRAGRRVGFIVAALVLDLCDWLMVRP